MRFISAQPDLPYFHWQVQTQIANFNQLGIESDLIVLFATRGDPSDTAKRIARHTSAQVHFIPDIRVDTRYAPSVQFHLYSKFFAEHQLKVPYMLVDCDVVFASMPPVHRLLEDSTIYMSDARSYVGYQYLASKGLDQLDVLTKIVGITSEDVRVRDAGAGGAQTIMKGFESPDFWQKVERDANQLYQTMSVLEPQWKGVGYPIQRWTAGMWSFLWNLWAAGAHTEISRRLDFCWGSDPFTKLKPIVHMAGVTHDMQDTHFFKGRYTTTSPFNDPAIVCPAQYNSISDLYKCSLVDAAKYWSDKL